MKKEWICPRCTHHNSDNNEVCMGAEIGDGRCGYEKLTLVKPKESTNKSFNQTLGNTAYSGGGTDETHTRIHKIYDR